MSLILVNIGKVFILKETSSYNSGEYRIDGNQMLSFSDIKRYQFDHVPLVESIQHKHEIEYYEKDGIRITLAEFNDTVKSMCHSHVDEDGDWDSIDAEFAYRKWREGWSPVYKDYAEYATIELPVLTQRESEFKEIIPMYQIGLVEDPLCVYDPTPISYIREFASEMGLEEAERSYWGSSRGYSSLKIYNQVKSDGKGTYNMYLGTVKLPIEFKQFKGTYEKCVDKRDEVRLCVKNTIQSAYDEQIATLTQDKAQVVLGSLRSIRSRINELNVYAKDRDNKKFAIRKVDETIDMIINTAGGK